METGQTACIKGGLEEIKDPVTIRKKENKHLNNLKIKVHLKTELFALICEQRVRMECIFSFTLTNAVRNWEEVYD